MRSLLSIGGDGVITAAVVHDSDRAQIADHGVPIEIDRGQGIARPRNDVVDRPDILTRENLQWIRVFFTLPDDGGRRIE